MLKKGDYIEYLPVLTAEKNLNEKILMSYIAF